MESEKRGGMGCAEGFRGDFHAAWRNGSVQRYFPYIRRALFLYDGEFGVYEYPDAWSEGIWKISGQYIWKESFVFMYFYDSLCAGAVLSAALSVGQRESVVHFFAGRRFPVSGSLLRTMEAGNFTL